MITLAQIAAVMLRIYSIAWFIYAFLGLIEMPADVLGILHYQTSHLATTAATETERYLSTQREIHLVVEFLRVGLYLGVGCAFLIFSRPLGRQLARGL